MSSPSLEDALRRCEEEPIRIPGFIQSHGVLIALDRISYEIEQASSNTELLIGKRAPDVIGTCFFDYIPEYAKKATKALIDAAALTYVNPFLIPLASGDTVKEVDAIAHTVSGDVTILELELDPLQEKNPASGAGLDNYLQLIQKSISKIASLDSVEDVCEVMVEDIRAFTGFDRVMVYRFAPDFHGEVIAEAKEASMESYLHLHFPASDIPAQARELYLTNPVRLLYDVDGIPAALEPRDHPRLGNLDLSNSVLRSMSPVHLQYLRNMGVSSTLTVSLVADGKLWGLIACHHRTPRFVPYSVRATASLYGTVMASKLVEKQRAQIGLKAFRSRQTVLRILSGMDDHGGIIGGISGTLPDLADVFEADGAAVLSGADFRYHGSVSDISRLAEAGENLKEALDGETLITDCTLRDMPFFATDLPRAAGVVAIPFGEKRWLVLFRDEVSRNIRWGGKPQGSESVSPAGDLTPRTSFSEWSEEVANCSLPWDESIEELTTEIRSAISSFVQRRNQILEDANSELRKFAGVVAHEVKNQLTSGMMALSLIQEDLEKTPERDEKLIRLVGLGSESLESLSQFTSDMLDFAKTESAPEVEDIDLNELVDEVVSSLRVNQDPNQISVQKEALPTVRGTRSQLRHVVMNLLKNANDHAKLPDRPLQIQVGVRRDSETDPYIFIRDNGRGIPQKDQTKIFDYFYSGSRKEFGGSGIGLAFCAQTINRSGHRLWVESEPDKGSAFCFTVTSVDALSGN